MIQFKSVRCINLGNLEEKNRHRTLSRPEVPPSTGNYNTGPAQPVTHPRIRMATIRERIHTHTSVLIVSPQNHSDEFCIRLRCRLYVEPCVFLCVLCCCFCCCCSRTITGDRGDRGGCCWSWSLSHVRYVLEFTAGQSIDSGRDRIGSRTFLATLHINNKKTNSHWKSIAVFKRSRRGA